MPSCEGLRRAGGRWEPVPQAPRCFFCPPACARGAPLFPEVGLYPVGKKRGLGSLWQDLTVKDTLREISARETPHSSGSVVCGNFRKAAPGKEKKKLLSGPRYPSIEYFFSLGFHYRNLNRRNLVNSHPADGLFHKLELSLHRSFYNYSF